MKYKAIIFDWDGVLYDSMTQVALNSVEVCETYGVKGSLEDYRKNAAQPFWKWFKSQGVPINTEEDKEEVQRRYWEIHRRNEKPHPLFPEAPQILKEIKNSGRELAIISSGLKDIIESILERENLIDLFNRNEIYGDVSHKADAISGYLLNNALSKTDGLMIGDLPSDIENGKEAGVDTVGIARWEAAAERLKQYQPTYLFGDLNGLWKELNS